MWRTPIGERILVGAEWDLFRAGLGLLKDQVETSLDDPDLAMTGVGAFDRLQPAAKLAMLALVGKALHDEAEPCVELTALSEGTFAAVYDVIRQFIEIEIDFAREGATPDDDESPLRMLVLAAFREVSPEWDGSLPAPDCEDIDEWTFLLDALIDRVLWDRDFDEEELFVDADPGQGQLLKRELGIVGDYFTAIAPEPTDDQLAACRESLRQLCQRAPQRSRPEPGDGNDNPFF
jgi:hypothetical protein